MTIETKAGARNSRSDLSMIQQIHDHASALGADCPGETDDGGEGKSARGRIEVKSITATHFTLAGPAAVYGGNDLARDYFDAQTDLWLDKLGSRKPCLWDHALDSNVKAAVLGYAEVSQDDDGVWFEAQIDRSKRYAEAILKLAEAGALGVSTGAVPHLVQRGPMKSGRYYLKSWPIAELSFTPEPMEPRLVDVRVLKSLAAIEPNLAPVLDLPAIKAAIAEKEQGNRSTPKEYAGVTKWGDPVNKKYPLDTAAHVRAALSYWGRNRNKGAGGYNSADWATIGKRIKAAARKLGIEVAGDNKAGKSLAYAAGVMPAFEGSYEDLAEDIAEACCAQMGMDVYCRVWATYPGYAVVYSCPRGDYGDYPDSDMDDEDEEFYRVEYTIGDDGEPVLGAVSKVQLGFVPAPDMGSEGEPMDDMQGKSLATRKSPSEGAGAQRDAEKALAELALLELAG